MNRKTEVSREWVERHKCRKCGKHVFVPFFHPGKEDYSGKIMFIVHTMFNVLGQMRFFLPLCVRRTMYTFYRL